MPDNTKENNNDTETKRTLTIETRNVPLETGEKNPDAEKDAAEKSTDSYDPEKPENS